MLSLLTSMGAFLEFLQLRLSQGPERDTSGTTPRPESITPKSKATRLSTIHGVLTSVNCLVHQRDQAVTNSRSRHTCAMAHHR